MAVKNFDGEGAQLLSQGGGGSPIAAHLKC
jgi:hypothetical protein